MAGANPGRAADFRRDLARCDWSLPSVAFARYQPHRIGGPPVAGHARRRPPVRWDWIFLPGQRVEPHSWQRFARLFCRPCESRPVGRERPRLAASRFSTVGLDQLLGSRRRGLSTGPRSHPNGDGSEMNAEISGPIVWRRSARPKARPLARITSSSKWAGKCSRCSRSRKCRPGRI